MYYPLIRFLYSAAPNGRLYHSTRLWISYTDMYPALIEDLDFTMKRVPGIKNILLDILIDLSSPTYTYNATVI
uniref:Uncharacterized protein n=1 Tax=Candidatus Kentrum sp. FM TaxID=2126340 RepID=A0A450S311_9GAMM|nr:MAG: hypothetical protein BECKFM1743A_GA0114220_100322 [Candidatus Kentron sp. FM]